MFFRIIDESVESLKIIIWAVENLSVPLNIACWIVLGTCSSINMGQHINEDMIKIHRMIENLKLYQTV
jgi:hypothetical protein